MELSYLKEEYVQSPHTACPGCGIPVALRFLLKVLGDKIVLVMPVGCESVTSNIPTRRLSYNGKPIMLLSPPFGSTASLAGGVKTALTLRGDTETQVVALAGDGATFDIGFQALSGAAERNDDIIYVCCDNEGYMNTGNQKSSATPQNVITTTTPYPSPKISPKKDISMIMAAHRIPYLATATIAYPEDLMRKVEKAKNLNGFRFFHLLLPCPTGWRFPSNLTIKISRLAVKSKMFPLYEVENGVNFTVNENTTAMPVSDYMDIQGRFSGISEVQKAELQNEIELRWRWLRWHEKFGKSEQ